MVGVYFVGLGAAMIGTGFADSPFTIAFGLAACGAFGAIYHPVGISWLVQSAVNRGTALGIVGLLAASARPSRRRSRASSSPPSVGVPPSSFPGSSSLPQA